jgi:transcriptional regulator with XRE-family HTH domain
MKKLEFFGNKNAISQQLRGARLKAKLTQNMLAARMQVLGINIDQQMISRVENNLRIVTDYELACFCKILRIDEKDLLKQFYEETFTD